MIISQDNNLDTLSQFSNLSSNIVTGGTAHPVKNISVFDSGWAFQLGRTGEQQTEIVAAGTPSGTVITSGTIVYNHPQDTPVYNIHFDKIIFKRSTTGTAGVATAITNGTISITPSALQTEFDDTTGLTTYAYKTQYYNSVSGDVSSESDWIIPGGPTFYSLQKIRSRIKGRLYSTGYIGTDDVIDDWINEWLEEMNTAAIKVNKDYLLGTTSVSFGTAGLGTITASDFMYPRKFEVTYDGTNYGTASKININEYDDSTTFGSFAPMYSWQGDTLFQVLPKGVGGTARITYSKGEAIFDNETDELPYPMRRYSRSFVEYGLYCAYGKDQKGADEDKHLNIAKSIKQDFINEISPRDNTGVETIDFIESLTGDDTDDFLIF